MLYKYLAFFLFLSFFGQHCFGQTKEEALTIRIKLSKIKGTTSEKAALLLSLSNYNLLKEGELKEDLDSATVYNNETRKISQKLKDNLGIGKTILQESSINREKGDLKKATSCALLTIHFARKYNFHELEADGYMELAHIVKIEEEFDKKIAYYQKAIDLYNKAKTKMKEADALKELSDFYIYKSNFKESIKAIKQALEIYKSVDYKEIQYPYCLLSKAYRIDGNLNKALEYGLLAEKTAQENNDLGIQRSTIQNHLGLIYKTLKNKKLAISYWNKSIEIAKQNKDTATIITVSLNKVSLLSNAKDAKIALINLHSITSNYSIINHLDEVRINYFYLYNYVYVKDYKRAKPYYEKLNFFLKNDEETEKIYLCKVIVNYLQKTNQIALLYSYLKQFEALAKVNNDNNLKADYELAHFKSDSISSNYKGALGHYQKYKIFSDSIFNLEKSKQFSSLELEYETEKKDNDIKFLKQQGQLQKTKIHNDAVAKYIFIASIFVLILFLGLLYNRFRLKQEANKNLEQKRIKIKEQNELLKKLVLEKEWLIKEIHHRVKNNLQIVISLLNTQSAYLDNEDALLAIQNSQHRMHAMSLIHQKLYQSENLSSINMSWYIKELVGYLRDCFETEKKIEYKLDTESVELDVSQSVPLGLILNEAISNAIKYAFPKDGKGTILIQLKNRENNHYQLIISDNGVGIPADFEIENRDSLGMNLMLGLSEQIDGNFEIKNDNGLTIIINFIKKSTIN